MTLQCVSDSKPKHHRWLPPVCLLFLTRSCLCLWQRVCSCRCNWNRLYLCYQNLGCQDRACVLLGVRVSQNPRTCYLAGGGACCCAGGGAAAAGIAARRRRGTLTAVPKTQAAAGLRCAKGKPTRRTATLSVLRPAAACRKALLSAPYASQRSPEAQLLILQAAWVSTRQYTQQACSLLPAAALAAGAVGVFFLPLLWGRPPQHGPCASCFLACIKQ